MDDYCTETDRQIMESEGINWWHSTKPDEDLRRREMAWRKPTDYNLSQGLSNWMRNGIGQMKDANILVNYNDQLLCSSTTRIKTHSRCVYTGQRTPLNWTTNCYWSFWCNGLCWGSRCADADVKSSRFHVSPLRISFLSNRPNERPSDRPHRWHG